jgi:hypothetical protein
MKFKILTVFLAICLIVACFAGCGNTDLRSYSDDNAEIKDPSSEDDAAESNEKDYTYAYEAYDPEELVMTINGLDVKWGEYFYWLYSIVYAIETNVGEIDDWDAVCSFDENYTYREYAESYALDVLTQYRVLESKSAELDVTLSDEDMTGLDEAWANAVETYGGGDESAVLDYLDSIFLPSETFKYINQATSQYYNCFEKMYGEKGSLCTDEEVMEYSQNKGYVAAKHILLSTIDDAGDPLPEETIAEKKALAEELLNKINSAQDKDAEFDELMTEHSEDPGLAYYPGGYCFLSGDMLPEFEEATLALAEGEISGIVETDYGFHIIERIPVAPNSLVEYTSADEQYDLRYTAALDMFDANLSSWIDEAEVVYAGPFENFDLASVF